MSICLTTIFFAGILLLIASSHSTSIFVQGKETGNTSKVIILHHFEDGISQIVNITNALLELAEGSVDVEEIFLDSYADLTGSELFNVALGLRKRNDIKAVLGPSRSAGVFLLHPHTILDDLLHVSPAAEDPVFEATDRFPRLIRMTTAYQIQVRSQNRCLVVA